jgi:hypothetical protein
MQRAQRNRFIRARILRLLAWQKDRGDTVPSVAGVQINQSGRGSLGPGMVVLFVQFTPGTALFDFLLPFFWFLDIFVLTRLCSPCFGFTGLS